LILVVSLIARARGKTAFSAPLNFKDHPAWRWSLKKKGEEKK
jgi:hypothetical protein